MDFRGDPSSALLEVLDPEQNHTFSDHYIELDFDLSDVMFIATSNSMNIPPALLDRMEVIRLAGYTEDEKLNIAQKYLLPKQCKNNGVKAGELDITESALRGIIRYYTREAGVRSLEREISKICRKVVKGIQLKKYEGQVVVTEDNLNDFLGVRKFDFGRAEKKNQVGQVVGLAWTEVGGDLLTIEAAVMPGKGNIIRTGQLGDVMKESVEAARSVVRSRARRLGIKDEMFEKRDIHIHVPDGATPKDGPSAGAAMTTAFVSALTGIPVRADVAMTGEITLRGEVTAIGGLKEKLLAAHRGGIKTVMIPEENVKDLQEIPENVKNRLEIVPVKWIDRVLEVALETVPQALPDEEPVPVATADSCGGSGHRHTSSLSEGYARRRRAFFAYNARFAGRTNHRKIDAGIAQLVERNLAKVEVASSSLVSRSRHVQGKPTRLPFSVSASPGAVAKRLCSGLQIRPAQFDSGPRLQPRNALPTAAKVCASASASHLRLHPAHQIA